MNSYSGFIKDVDTVLMGWNTYHQIVTELSPEEWIYGGLTTYVVTHREQASAEDIRFTDEASEELVRSDKGAESRMGYFMSGYGRVDGWKRALL